MYPNNGEKIISLKSFPSVMGVIDVVYNPLRTGLVLDALDMGIKAEGGLYMLSSQAVYASELFTDSVLGENVSKRVFNGVLNEKENIVLVGMPSSGKTTVGRYLAGLTERKFVDTDEEIVKKIGMDIKTYFKKYGEEAFRDVESEVIKEVSKESGLIIATGGGAILRTQNVRDLKQNGRIYFINRSLEMLTPTDDRPLSSDFSELEKRYKERYPIYCSVADVTVPSNGAVKQIAEIIKGEFYR
jgi:shikimate dehydrogenase